MLNTVTYESSAPVARRLVLVHGFTQNAEVWRPLAELLTERFQVVCVDLPGHGQTGAEYDESDLWATAELLTGTCGPAVYCGYSLGARVVLHAAIADPSHVANADASRVEGAILFGAKAGFRDAHERRARQLADDLLADRIETLGDDHLDEFINDWLAQPFNAALSDEAKFRDARLRNRAAGLATNLRRTGSGAQEPLWPQLGAIEAPTLIIRGENDLSNVIDESDDMAEAIGDNAKLLVVQNTGHAGPFEKPTLYAEMIETFLS